MNDLIDFVLSHTERGECKCGRCIDFGSQPDPVGHTADLVFFKVAKRGTPSLEDFKRLTAAQDGCNPFDGQEHNYIELGAWIGDQGLAMLYMGLGTLLGAFRLLTPKSVLGLDGDLAMQMAGAGMVVVQARG